MASNLCDCELIASSTTGGGVTELNVVLEFRGRRTLQCVNTLSLLRLRSCGLVSVSIFVLIDSDNLFAHSS